MKQSLDQSHVNWLCCIEYDVLWLADYGCLMLILDLQVRSQPTAWGEHINQCSMRGVAVQETAYKGLG